MRAKTDAALFTNASEQIYKDRAVYYQQGRLDAYQSMNDIVSRWNFNPANKRMLEIGCGIGRQVEGFSEMFKEVVASDISLQMLNEAKAWHNHLNNVQFVKINGQDFSDILSNYFDFIYSYAVFQHIPERQLVAGYFKEIHRLLKPGGLFKIQLHTRLLNAKWSKRLSFIPVPQFAINFTRLAAWMLKSYRSVRISTRHTALIKPLNFKEVSHMVKSNGLTLLGYYEDEIDGLINTWCVGKKDY